MVVDSGKEALEVVDDKTINEEELHESYERNLANGKKNMLCGDYPEAVACFQEACSLQSERYGDTSPECAETFFYYGKALLELARVENTVLGNALKGVPETEDSDSEADDQVENATELPAEEREQLRLDVEEAMASQEESTEDEETSGTEQEAGESSSPSEEADQENTGAEEKTDEASKESENQNTGAEEKGSEASKESDTQETDAEQKTDEPSNEADNQNAVDTECPSTSDEVAKKSTATDESCTEDPDDIPNMQLAWEMLELAKVLYSKKPENQIDYVMVAQCHLKLGELGLEIENYPQAVGDFQECLAIHQKHLPDFDRKLAETHYNLGLAYSFDRKYDSALEQYRMALDVLEKRIEHLNEIIDEQGDKDDKSVLHECAEVGEIKTLIPDINSKIEDVILMKKQDRQLPTQGETSTGFGSSSSARPACLVKRIEEGASGSASNQSANDISHLIRRKRTSDEKENENPVEGELHATKKKKADNTVAEEQPPAESAAAETAQ